jgi:hypothetical protein
MDPGHSRRDADSEIIYMSVAKYVALLAFLVGIAIVCAGVVYAQGEIAATPVLAILACLVGLPFVVFQMFVGQILIVGVDCLEWVQGRSKVIGRIPFANIDSVDIYQTGLLHSIRITLINRKDSGTFWPRGERGLRSGRKTVLGEPDCDIRLPAIWQEPAESIVSKIGARLER